MSVPPLELVLRGSAIYWFIFLLVRFDLGAVCAADRVTTGGTSALVAAQGRGVFGEPPAGRLRPARLDSSSLLPP